MTDFFLKLRRYLAFLSLIHRMHQRHIDQVLTDEPDLQFISAQNFTDDQVIRPIVAIVSARLASLRQSRMMI